MIGNKCILFVLIAVCLALPADAEEGTIVCKNAGQLATCSIVGYRDDYHTFFLNSKITNQIEQEFEKYTDNINIDDAMYSAVIELEFGEKAQSQVVLTYWSDQLIQFHIFVPKSERNFALLVSDYTSKYGKGCWDSDDYLMFCDNDKNVIELTEFEDGTSIYYLSCDYIEWACGYYGKSPCRGLIYVEGRGF